MFRKVVKTYHQSFAGLSKETWLLSFVMLINRAGTMAVPFMGLYVTHYLHRPLTDATLLISLFGVGAILGAIAGGKLTDVIGFRPVQIISQTVSGILFIVFAQVHQFPTLCSLVFFIALIGEAFRPANFTAIASYASDGKHTRSYSLNRLAINLGWAVGGSIGGLIASINYRLLFWVDGCSNIIAGLCILAFLPSAKTFKNQVKKQLGNVISNPPWKDPIFMKFILLCTAFTTCFFLTFRLVPIFWKSDWNIDEKSIGLILGANGIIVAVFEMVLVARWENKRSAFNYILMGVLFTGAAYLVMLLPIHFPKMLALIGVVFVSFGEMLAIPFINSFVVKRSNETNRGQYAAANTLTWSIAQVVGPLGGGFLAAKFGYNVVWALLTGVCLLTAYGYRCMGTILEKKGYSNIPFKKK